MPHIVVRKPNASRGALSWMWYCRANAPKRWGGQVTAFDPASVITTITAAIKLVGEIRDAGKAIDEAQLKLKLAEVTSALADAKMGAVDFKEQIDGRDKEISRLKLMFALKAETVEANNMTYVALNGKPVGMPLCPRCLQMDGVMMRLTALQKEGKPAQCPQCKSDYERQTEYLRPK